MSTTDEAPEVVPGSVLADLDAEQLDTAAAASEILGEGRVMAASRRQLREARRATALRPGLHGRARRPDMG